MGVRWNYKLFCHMDLFISFLLPLFAHQKYQEILVFESAISYQLFQWIDSDLFFPSSGILKMLIILNWNLRLIVVPIIGCLCINYTVLRLWGVNLRERKWWKDSWWQNYEIRTSVRWRMDWGLSCAFCLFTFLCFCVLNIMHRENVWYSWLAWIHHGWLKLRLG